MAESPLAGSLAICPRRDHSDCADFANGSGSFYAFTGLRNDPSGLGCGCCCGLGCTPCRADASVFVGGPGGHSAHLDGERWMRPARNDRDARGIIHDLRSNQPHRIPVRHDYDRAPCYDQAGNECYPGGPDERVLCQCANIPDLSLGSDLCEGHEGEPAPGLFSDDFANAGGQLHARQEQVQCRTTIEYGTKIVEARPVRLFNASLVRLSRGEQSCTSNRFAPCLGRAFVDECTVEGGLDTGEAFIGVDRSMYDFCHIENYTCTLKDQGSQWQSRPSFLLRKMAIEKAGTLPGMDQLTCIANTFTEGAGSLNANSNLDLWQRQYNPDCVTAMAQGLLWDLPDCYLRASGLRVHARIFVRFVDISMSLVAHLLREEGLADPEHWHLRPLATIRVFVKLAIHAEIAEEIPVDAYWNGLTPTIDNDPQCNRFPFVLGPRNESIVYVDPEGNEFNPPQVATWEGDHGPFGVDPWRDIEHDVGNGQVIECCRMAVELSPLVMKGIITHPDEQTNHDRLYGGEVKINFITSQWCNQCADATDEFDGICDDGGGGGGGGFPPTEGPPGGGGGAGPVEVPRIPNFPDPPDGLKPKPFPPIGEGPDPELPPVGFDPEQIPPVGEGPDPSLPEPPDELDPEIIPPVDQGPEPELPPSRIGPLPIDRTKPDFGAVNPPRARPPVGDIPDEPMIPDDPKDNPPFKPFDPSGPIEPGPTFDKGRHAKIFI